MSGKRCIPPPSSFPKRCRTDTTSIPKASVCNKTPLKPSKIGIARRKDHEVRRPTRAPTETSQQLTKLQNENKMYKEELRKIKEIVIKCDEKRKELEEQLQKEQLKHGETIDFLGSKQKSAEAEHNELRKQVNSLAEKIRSFHLHPVTLEPLFSPAEEEELRQQRQKVRQKNDKFIEEQEKELDLLTDMYSECLSMIGSINVKPLYPVD
ncbi:uncharacterized protein LOC102809461 isoform X2 [Saccoglossus kowalevskii]|uniref:Protein Daple-like n=1 Tax=Saccoglossus kowalevskii TaxID=10224 RepID=A0ABM0MRZ5_SACKO|nr:PREDICTED: protein Daple-like [Saccoglossus kowalevskii]